MKKNNRHSKKLLLLSIFICFLLNAHGQIDKPNYWGVRFSHGKSDYTTGEKRSDNIFSPKKYFTSKDYLAFGLDYTYRCSKDIEISTGMSFVFNNLTYTGRSSSDEGTHTLAILSVPIRLKMPFLKYLFIESGISFNYHPDMGYTWGLGGEVMIGAEYTFKSGLSIYLGPHGQCNVLSMGDQLTLKGVRLGVGYRF